MFNTLLARVRFAAAHVLLVVLMVVATSIAAFLATRFSINIPESTADIFRMGLFEILLGMLITMSFSAGVVFGIISITLFLGIWFPKTITLWLKRLLKSKSQFSLFYN